jgi:alkylation response protein AidB-like acyl-CoA dehydrogenase
VQTSHQQRLVPTDDHIDGQSRRTNAQCLQDRNRDIAMEVTTDAVRLFGGAGNTMNFPVEPMTRDANITQIYEGTNQIQRVVMARALPA